MLGHRKIAFISGPRDLHSAQSRQTAFIGALEECGIKSNPLWMVEGDHTMEGGIKAMHRLLQLSQPPTAVMCSNDMTAIGVLHQVYRAGLRIPEDLSVIGFDDIHIAQVTIPPLTTIQMSCFELARAAVTALRRLWKTTGSRSAATRSTRALLSANPRATPKARCAICANEREASNERRRLPAPEPLLREGRLRGGHFHFDAPGIGAWSIAGLLQVLGQGDRCALGRIVDPRQFCC